MYPILVSTEIYISNNEKQPWKFDIFFLSKLCCDYISMPQHLSIWSIKFYPYLYFFAHILPFFSLKNKPRAITIVIVDLYIFPLIFTHK